MTVPAMSRQPADTEPPVVAPPPCWCGRALEDHAATHDHAPAPAGGVESEAHDAW